MLFIPMECPQFDSFLLRFFFSLVRLYICCRRFSLENYTHFLSNFHSWSPVQCDPFGRLQSVLFFLFISVPYQLYEYKNKWFFFLFCCSRMLLNLMVCWFHNILVFFFCVFWRLDLIYIYICLCVCVSNQKYVQLKKKQVVLPRSNSILALHFFFCDVLKHRSTPQESQCWMKNYSQTEAFWDTEQNGFFLYCFSSGQSFSGKRKLFHKQTNNIIITHTYTQNRTCLPTDMSRCWCQILMLRAH